MTAIQKALGSLFEALENLEGAAAGQQISIREMRQRELFQGGARPPAVDPALLAKRLDAAIDKVELVLRGA